MKKILILIFTFFCFTNVFAYSKSVVDITNMNIYEIQEAIDDGYLTYELLTKLYLERIEVYDKEFNTMITINEKAIEEAREKDLIYNAEGRDSILFGIPIVVKDNIDVYGLPTTMGTKSLKNSYPNKDSEVISYLKEKGAIILGKTNMSEFAFMASSSTSSYGTVKNAYNTLYTSYGSSGGTATAVSLNFATLGIGTDTNASIRVPASAGNVIGMRPTYGALSNSGVLLYDISRDTIGVISKNTIDNAIVLSVMSGNDETYYLKNIKEKQNFKIGIINDFLIGNNSGVYGTEKTDEKIVEKFNKVIDKLKDNGVEVIYLEDFYSSNYSNIESTTRAGWSLCYNFNNYIKNTNSTINNFYDLNYDKGHIYSLWNYLTDCTKNVDKISDYEKIKEPYKNYIYDIYEKYDLDFLVYPTTKNTLLKLDDDTSLFSSPSSLISPVLGLPSMSLSLGEIDDLYYGIEFVSLKNTEEKMYKFSYFYENINKTYELSDLAPPLYEIPEIVLELKNLYESSINLSLLDNLNIFKIKNYNEKRLSVKNFLSNYDNYDEEVVEEKALRLYNDYNMVVSNLNKFTNIIILFILMLLIIIFIIKKRNKGYLCQRKNYRKKNY